MRQWLGSIAFTAYLFASVAVYGLLVLSSAPFPHRVTYRLCRYWAGSVLFVLRKLCRLDYVVEGRQNLPDKNTVVLVKHSSAFETIAQLRLFPTQTWVMKRELLWAPILGWILLLLRPIAINRSAGRSAVQQVIAQGQQRLADGFWVMIFPEGTRVPAGESRPYGLSGVLLAKAAGRPVVPVAHNAGEFWPRRGWLKRSGTIRVVIGAPISTAEKEPRQINAEVQTWIESTLAEISTAT